MVVLTVGGGEGKIDQRGGDYPQKPNIKARGLNISAGVQVLRDAHGGDLRSEGWVVVRTVGSGCG